MVLQEDPKTPVFLAGNFSVRYHAVLPQVKTNAHLPVFCPKETLEKLFQDPPNWGLLIVNLLENGAEGK